MELPQLVVRQRLVDGLQHPESFVGVFFEGFLTPQKTLDRLLEAVKTAPKVKLAAADSGKV